MKCRKEYKDQQKYQTYRNNYNQRYYEARNFVTNKCRRWTEEDLKLIMDHNETDTELARKLGRSVRSIQVLRSRQKKLLKEKSA